MHKVLKKAKEMKGKNNKKRKQDEGKIMLLTRMKVFGDYLI